MNNLKVLFKVAKLFLARKYVDLIDISNSYTKVSSNYNNSFLNEMHKYNEEMLDKLIYESITNNSCMDNNGDRGVNVLDLACGTGFNSSYINYKLKDNYDIKFTLIDISKGMLDEAQKRNNFKSEFVEKDMLSYLKECDDNSFDIVVCAWAIKYQNPHKIINEIHRVLKKNGFIAVIVNLKSTLPEVRKIYPKIIRSHSNKINKIMLELPNPISENSFNRWFTRKGFNKVYSKSGSHKFNFKNSYELVKWITSTGALAGFDIMINMNNLDVKETMSKLFKKNNISCITHKFVWGVYKNEK